MRDLELFFESLFPQYRDRIRQGTISIIRLQRWVYRYATPVYYPARRKA